MTNQSQSHKKVALILIAVVLCVAGVALTALAVSRMIPPTCTPGTVGCAPGLVSTLKAMPSETPEPSATPGASPTPCGGLCWPTVTPEAGPTIEGPHMIYPHREPIPGKPEAGNLRPWRPGYPYDVSA